jgi:hypothetical protein
MCGKPRQRRDQSINPPRARASPSPRRCPLSLGHGRPRHEPAKGKKERKKENILAQQERLLGTYLAPKYGSNCTTAQTHFGRRDVRQVGHEYKIRTRPQPKLALSRHRLAPCKPLIKPEIKPERESMAGGVPEQGRERLTEREVSTQQLLHHSFVCC